MPRRTDDNRRHDAFLHGNRRVAASSRKSEFWRLLPSTLKSESGARERKIFFFLAQCATARVRQLALAHNNDRGDGEDVGGGGGDGGERTIRAIASVV